MLSVASLARAADAPPRIKVMPLGDSLTQGYALTPELSYRKKLRDALRQAGVDIDYVGGSKQDVADPLNDLAHQGQQGATVAQIDGDAAWQSYRPDVILLMAGTNDFRMTDVSSGLGAFGMVSNASAIATLLEKINAYYAVQGLKLNIFVSSIPPMGYASVTGSSTVLDTLRTFLESDGRDFGVLGAPAGAVAEAKLMAAFSPLSTLLARRGLHPDLSGMFRAADRDGDAVLSEAEYGDMLKSIGEFILNKYITDYNNNLRALASTVPNVHFVDAGSQLALTDFSDGTHPATQQGYDKLAPAWLTAIQAFLADQPRYWVGASGSWVDGSNWAISPGGPGGAGQPAGGSVFLLQDDAIDRGVTRDQSALPAPLLDLRIDASGNGAMTLLSQADLAAVLMGVGLAGKGQVVHSGGNTTVATIVLGSEAGSNGSYRLDGANTSLNTVLEEIGFAGSGSFTQHDGSNDVLRQLILGFSAGGFGSYTLEHGMLSVNEEYVGLHGTGRFIQSGGIHRVLARTSTAGGVEGTLAIASEAGSQGSFLLQGGELSAVRLLNGGSVELSGGTLSAEFLSNSGNFDYSGGILTATQFLNNGVWRVHGIRELNGDLFHFMNGQIHFAGLFGAGTPSRLDVAGAVEMEGPIYVTLAGGAAPRPGDSAEIMHATHGIAPLLPGLVRLPLLPGKLILRAAVVERALRITVDQVNCDDVLVVRATLGRQGPRLAGDVNNDGVVNVRDLAIIAQKLPAGASCTF
ncbi:hypothetical protein HSX11_19635 [Oxalobacteraceae bacterium]|nr:hypothetical protein [Oxalobacteraceae bacterium]